MKNLVLLLASIILAALMIFSLCCCATPQTGNDSIVFSRSLTGYGYDGCYFYCENGKAFVCNSLTEQVAEFYGDGISECYANGEYLYCVKDNSVIAVNISDKSEKTVLTSESAVSDIYASADCVFYRSGNALYLYRADSGTTEKLIENDELCEYIPYSSEYIEYSVRSEEWAEYYRENGLANDEWFDEILGSSMGYFGSGLRREWYGYNAETGESKLLGNYPSDYFGGESGFYNAVEKYGNSIDFPEMSDEETAKTLHARITPLFANDKFSGVYRASKTDLSSLDEEYIRSCVDYAFPPSVYNDETGADDNKGLEEYCSGMADRLGIGDGLTDTFYVCPDERFEYCVKQLFGKDAAVTHKGFTSSAARRYYMYSENNKCYYIMYRDEAVQAEYTVFDGYEKNDDEYIVYDKYLYYDAAARKAYASSEKETEIDVKIYNDFSKTVEEFGIRYRHSFALAEDGTYYWVSTEPVK